MFTREYCNDTQYRTVKQNLAKFELDPVLVEQNFERAESDSERNNMRRKELRETDILELGPLSVIQRYQ